MQFTEEEVNLNFGPDNIASIMPKHLENRSDYSDTKAKQKSRLE